MTITIEQKRELKSRWKNNPSLFRTKVLNSPKFEDYQQDAFDLICKPETTRILIRSANSMGKTFLSADTILTLLYNFGPCTIITTAPSWNLVENVLWAEIRDKYNKANYPLGGDLSLTKLKLGDKWFAIGFSPKIVKDGDSSTFQGFHNKFVFIVFEEATGINQQIYDSAERMMTSANVKWLCIFNPTDSTAAVAKLWDKFGWTKLIWDCFKSPNLKINNITNIDHIRSEVAKVMSMRTDEDRFKYLNSYLVANEQLITAKFVIEKCIDWGEESPLFQACVLAKFPRNLDNTLVSINRMEELMQGSYIDPETRLKNYYSVAEGNAFHIASDIHDVFVDVARFGSDKSVITHMQGNMVYPQMVWSKQDTTFIAGEVQKLINLDPNGQWRIGVDATGVGSGVIDALRNDPIIGRAKNIRIYEIHFGGAAMNENYYNIATEMWFLAAKDIHSKEGFLLDKNDILMAELTARKYKYGVINKRSVYQIESKDEYKKRVGGHSCDNADSFIGCNYLKYIDTMASGKFDESFAEPETKSEIRWD